MSEQSERIIKTVLVSPRSGEEIMRTPPKAAAS
jgi:hypothetical protein